MKYFSNEGEVESSSIQSVSWTYELLMQLTASISLSSGWHSNIVTRRTNLTLQVYLSNHSILNPDNNALLTYNLTEVLRAGLAAEIIWDWNEAVSFQFSEVVRNVEPAQPQFGDRVVTKRYTSTKLRELYKEMYSWYRNFWNSYLQISLSLPELSILLFWVFVRVVNVSYRGYEIAFRFPKDSFMYILHWCNV